MARTFDNLVRLVRDWSNRDVEALPDTIIADSVRYAADKAYRHLRIAPLENTIVYDEEALRMATSSANNRFASVTELQIPVDLIEFIQIREIDANGRTTRIFNEKADLRTFNDLYAEKYNDFAFWTRQGNCVLLAPGFGNVGQNFGSTGVGNSTGIELHYYRRLPALYARYDVNAANASTGGLLVPIFNEGSTTEYFTGNEVPTPETSTLPEISMIESTASGLDAIPTSRVWRLTQTDNDGQEFVSYFDTMEMAVAARPDGATDMTAPIQEIWAYGLPIQHWLKDENERVVLMGALAEVFFYLQEDDQAQKYTQLFQQELAELNNEDVMRNASGGNVQVNFNGRGLI